MLQRLKLRETPKSNILCGSYHRRAARGTWASHSRWASVGNSGNWCLSNCSWRLSSLEPMKRNKCLTVGGKSRCKQRGKWEGNDGRAEKAGKQKGLKQQVKKKEQRIRMNHWISGVLFCLQLSECINHSCIIAFAAMQITSLISHRDNKDGLKWELPDIFFYNWVKPDSETKFTNLRILVQWVYMLSFIQTREAASCSSGTTAVYTRLPLTTSRISMESVVKARM